MNIITIFLIDITDTIDEYTPAINTWRTLPIRLGNARAGFAM